MKLSKKAYLHSFTIIVLILAVFRFVSSSSFFSSGKSEGNLPDPLTASTDSTEADNTVVIEEKPMTEVTTPEANRHFTRILSVPRYDAAFPDLNDVQLEAATKNGVSPVENRKDAERRKNDLVYVGANPYVHVDNLKLSIPYLVPKASILLQDIGRAFYDSLDAKGVALHKIITTSVLRTKEDVEKLRTRNTNATENSCHLYGTTFDICYNRYITVEDPTGPKRRTVTNDTLKWVLSEVLRDQRKLNRCYVKYEVKQGCFHITVR